MARFYAIDEANARLAELRPLLEQLRDDRAAVAELQAELVKTRQTNGSTEHADELARREADVREIVKRMQQAVTRIDGWGIGLRDIGTGLVDFPALANGRPVWLCWKLGENEINWWHDVDKGFDSRLPLTELS